MPAVGDPGGGTALLHPNLWNGRKIGLLGGSFNPAHAGHRHISLYSLKALGLDQVWWLVSPQNPLKPTAGMAALTERISEARRVANHPRILVTDLECRLGTCYTADTLARIRCRFPRTRFIWLMGADNLRQIPRWRHWERIFATVPVAVLARPTYSLRALGGKAAQRFRRCRVKERRARRLACMKPPAWVFLRNPLHPASATEIRARRTMAQTARVPRNGS